MHTKAGYHFIQTPIMLNRELWETSGHWFNYKENMYTSTIDDSEFAIKPMNCPGGMLVYKNSLHSYKDLPLRVGELGQVHRHEASGALNGLFRVRTFTQDDAHIFMTPDQIESEVIRLIAFIDRVYSSLGLPYDIELSTRPEEKYIGDLEKSNVEGILNIIDFLSFVYFIPILSSNERWSPTVADNITICCWCFKINSYTHTSSFANLKHTNGLSDHSIPSAVETELSVFTIYSSLSCENLKYILIEHEENHRILLRISQKNTTFAPKIIQCGSINNKK